MNALKILPKPIRKALAIIVFPVIFTWITISIIIMKIGDGLHWLGDAMTGFRAGDMDL